MWLVAVFQGKGRAMKEQNEVLSAAVTLGIEDRLIPAYHQRGKDPKARNRPYEASKNIRPPSTLFLHASRPPTQRKR